MDRYLFTHKLRKQDIVGRAISMILCSKRETRDGNIITMSVS
jgi:hypothetical protein